MLRREGTFIGNIVSKEADVSESGDNTAIFDITRKIEIEPSGEEVFVRNMAGRGSDPSNIDHRAIFKKDSVGICEDDMPIRIQRAEDVCGIRIGHSVEHAGVAARLDELHSLATPDIKALKIEHRTVSRTDRH